MSVWLLNVLAFDGFVSAANHEAEDTVVHSELFNTEEAAYERGEQWADEDEDDDGMRPVRFHIARIALPPMNLTKWAQKT